MGADDLQSMDFNSQFRPIENSRHRTLSSARFFPDYAKEHEAIVIGTGREASNAIAVLGIEGFELRKVGVRRTTPNPLASPPHVSPTTST